MKTHDLRCNSFLEIPSSHFTTLFFLIIYLYYIFNCLVNMFIILFTIIHWNLLPVGEMLSLSLKGVYMQSSYQLIKSYFLQDHKQSSIWDMTVCMYRYIYIDFFWLFLFLFYFFFISPYFFSSHFPTHISCIFKLYLISEVVYLYKNEHKFRKAKLWIQESQNIPTQRVTRWWM